MGVESTNGYLLHVLRLEIDGLDCGRLLYCDTFLKLEEDRYHSITDSVPEDLYFTPRVSSILEGKAFPKIRGFLRSELGFSQLLNGELALSDNEILYLENRLGMMVMPVAELKKVTIISHKSETWLELDTDNLPLDKSKSLVIRLTSEFLSTSFLKLSKMIEENKVEVKRED